MSTYEVYSYGMISSSTLHLLETSFPEPDAYSEIKSTYRMVGGEAANSSIVLSKLGVKVKLDGNCLGNTSDGSFTRALLESYGINSSRLTLKDGYEGVQEIVFADKNTRTNFGTYCRLLFSEKQWNTPQKEDIASSKVVCLDPFFGDDSALAADYCRQLSKPYVTIDCSYDSPIAKHAEVIIISGEFRKREFSKISEDQLFRKYLQYSDSLVIFTAGSSDIIYGVGGRISGTFRPYKVEAVDTAGAGDSFRSGIIYGILQGWPAEKSINFASAVAACICRSFPGVLNSPSIEEVNKLMESRK